MTADSASRLVVTHGFTQTHHHVHPLALALARRCGFARLVLPDLPGHGLSAAAEEAFDETADQLAHRCGAGTYLGYSMGGRFALAAAVARPDLVQRLVLIGATAGIDDRAAAEQRRQADAERADQLGQYGLDRFLADWLAMPMFAGVPDSADDLRHRARNTPFGLAYSLRTAGTGSMTPLWDRLQRVNAPTLLITGASDQKFTAVAERLRAALPSAESVAIAGAGHAAHLERPAETLDLIADWLDRTQP